VGQSPVVVTGPDEVKQLPQVPTRWASILRSELDAANGR